MGAEYPHREAQAYGQANQTRRPAKAGLKIPINRGSEHPERERARIMSLDAVMPFVDGERGARARLEQLYEDTYSHYEKILQECRDRNDDESDDE